VPRGVAVMVRLRLAAVDARGYFGKHSQPPPALTSAQTPENLGT
jgi:hypothetical protein